MRNWLFAGLALLSLPAWAATNINVDDIAGVYKDRFTNGLVDGTKFTSENILEVVKFSSNEAYVRSHLEFYNGHFCSFRVIAKVEGDALVWRHPAGDGRQCELRMRFGDGKVTFLDRDGVCREESCGARGGYDRVTFSAKSRRTIRYMPRLLASPQYKAAVAERGK
ncbi:MAG TPA: hypothetical protein VJ753_02565 [Rhizomicrobium sp.]|nr:hypothetical protein [Rhizomicrobium sp.]